MNSLEMYKKLSDEDKKNLTEYSIYNSIYIIAKNQDYEISDSEVATIKELSYYVYLKDEYYNFSPSRISDFITYGYLEHNIPLEKFGEMSWSDILIAIDDDDYSFEERLER